MEGVPDRPEAFIPLGSLKGDIQEEIMADLKEQANLSGASDKSSSEADSSRADEQQIERELMNHWKGDASMRQERSCISAN